MAGLEDLMTAAQLSAAVDLLRFDYHIEAFEFKPSLGLVAKAFMKLGEDFQDMSEPLKRGVKDVMTISILENFMSGGRPAWDELSNETIKRRQQNGQGTMILVRSGALAEAASSVGIWSIGKATATVRNLPANVWYGKIHQAGYGGGGYSGGQWFKKYQDAARKTLGAEADGKEVDQLAFKFFDKRTTEHGAAPRSAPAIPARPFIMFQPEDVDAIQLIFYAWLEEKVTAAGL